jgi:hypothetical protein
MADLKQSRTFKLKSVVLVDSKGNTRDITGLCASFTYAEKITAPFVMASLLVSDSANLFNSVAFAGGETVQIRTTDVSGDQNNEDTTYELRVWKVANRYVKDKKQHYTLGLISPEALANEGTRVTIPLKGKAEKIIEDDLIKGSLNSDKDVFVDPSQFEINMLPNRRRPFDIANLLTTKAIPAQQNWGQTSETTGNGDTATVTGTAGYFFWESKRGYNFYSVDSLCSLEDEDREIWGPYIEQQSNQDGANEQFNILDAKFTSEIDVMTNLRTGKYSTLVVFYNPSTGQYDEYVYKLKDSYSQMEHLGSGELDKIPNLEIDLSEYPTRIMSSVLDHETWFSEGTPASPDNADGSTKPATFPDWQKYFAAQSMARFSTLKNQECTIVIPGNSQICAGDRVEIKLRNKVSSKEANNEPWDQESSGVYLINEVTHDYDTLRGTSGAFQTTLRLFRDAYGAPDTASNHQ